MDMNKAIVVEDVSKKYTLYKNTKDRLLDFFSPKSLGESFYALQNVNFTANHGEVVGFIGTNGSGKSTLSNIIAGIVPETSGKVTVNGDTSLIAVAAGLKNDLTGRDNIELKLLMLGFNKEEIKNLEDDIIEFSELGDFIDQPVKSYSSGMKSRLGFSISVNVDPDILIIDEALSVGDRAFAEKSLDKMIEFKEEGKTMIFVSHSLSQMRKFCDKILWLEFGRVKAYGDVGKVIPQYEELLNMWKKLPKKEREVYREKAINNQLDYDAYLKRTLTKSTLASSKERLTSKIARIRSGNSVIYESYDNKLIHQPSLTFTNYTYYIKKETVYNGKKYYLLSKQPSAVNGVIGWMKEEDLKVHRLIKIDLDHKKFYLRGTGKAVNVPWGAKHNIVFASLADYKDEEFVVKRTEQVRSEERRV